MMQIHCINWAACAWTGWVEVTQEENDGRVYSRYDGDVVMRRWWSSGACIMMISDGGDGPIRRHDTTEHHYTLHSLVNQSFLFILPYRRHVAFNA